MADLSAVRDQIGPALGSARASRVCPPPGPLPPPRGAAFPPPPPPGLGADKGGPQIKPGFSPPGSPRLTLAVACEGREVTTIEGLAAADGELHPDHRGRR